MIGLSWRTCVPLHASAQKVWCAGLEMFEMKLSGLYGIAIMGNLFLLLGHCGVNSVDWHSNGNCQRLVLKWKLSDAIRVPFAFIFRDNSFPWLTIIHG